MPASSIHPAVRKGVSNHRVNSDRRSFSELKLGAEKRKASFGVAFLHYPDIPPAFDRASLARPYLLPPIAAICTVHEMLQPVPSALKLSPELIYVPARLSPDACSAESEPTRCVPFSPELVGRVHLAGIV